MLAPAQMAFGSHARHSFDWSTPTTLGECSAHPRRCTGPWSSDLREMRPEPKRRRLDSLKLLRLARLQRYVRRYLAVRNWDDPISGAPLRRATSLALVEPGCVEYRFDPATLCDFLLRTANFTHPVTRRPLQSLEVRRLRRLLPEHKGRLLALTWEFQLEIRQELTRNREEVDLVEDHSGALWAGHLDSEEAGGELGGELGGGFGDAPASGAEYLIIMSRLGELSPAAAHRALAVHGEQLRRRAAWYDSESLEYLEGLLRRASALLPVQSTQHDGLAEGQPSRGLTVLLAHTLPVAALPALPASPASPASPGSLVTHGVGR